MNIKDIHEEIHDRTYDLYKEQTQNLPILNNIGKITNQNTHFKLKYKLPHHLVIKKSIVNIVNIVNAA